MRYKIYGFYFAFKIFFCIDFFIIFYNMTEPRNLDLTCD